MQIIINVLNQAFVDSQLRTLEKPQGVPFNILTFRRVLTCICVLNAHFQRSYRTVHVAKHRLEGEPRDQGSVWDRAQVKGKFSKFL